MRLAPPRRVDQTKGNRSNLPHTPRIKRRVRAFPDWARDSWRNSARIFRMLNEVAIEAIETGAERITDEALERYKPVGEDEAAFQ